MAKPSEKTSWDKDENQGEERATIHGLKSPDFELDEASPTFCQRAVELIRNHADSNSGQPFFLYYASPIPHSPWVPSNAFKGKSGHGDYGDFVMQLDDHRRPDQSGPEGHRAGSRTPCSSSPVTTDPAHTPPG